MTGISLHEDILEGDCFSSELFERAVRTFVRTRYGDDRPVKPREVDVPSQGFKSIGNKASSDLLRLERALWHARKRAADSNLTQHERRLRHAEVDALFSLRRYLLNAEAGDKYSEYDLDMRASGPEVVIVARKNGRR